uniref:B1292H11.10 protein n=1 Tax=Oryza sativa subsp. japonica TaxID=39947 RepID=Q6MWC1_ORYSJ|nr:B1292H11.10 [Oryza sativa Japonica Group]
MIQAKDIRADWAKPYGKGYGRRCRKLTSRVGSMRSKSILGERHIAKGAWRSRKSFVRTVVISTTAGADRGDLRAKPLRANATEEGREGEGCKAKGERSRRGDGRRRGSRAFGVHRRSWGSTIGFGTRATTATFSSCCSVGAGAEYDRRGEGGCGGKGAPGQGRDPCDEPSAGAPSRFVSTGNDFDRTRRSASQPNPEAQAEADMEAMRPNMTRLQDMLRQIQEQQQAYEAARQAKVASPPILQYSAGYIPPQVYSQALIQALPPQAMQATVYFAGQTSAATTVHPAPHVQPQARSVATQVHPHHLAECHKQWRKGLRLCWHSFKLSFSNSANPTTFQIQPLRPNQRRIQVKVHPVGCRRTSQGAAIKAGGEKGLPLSGRIKNRPIPPQFKFLSVLRYSDETDPKEFLSIYESAIEAAHGDENTKAKRPGESIREYMRRFSQARCQVQDKTEASVINAASAGLLEGELTRKIANKELQTLEHLLRIIDGYARGEEDSKRRQAIQAEYDKVSVAATQAQVQAQIAEPAPLTIRQPQPANQEQPPRPGQAPSTWRKFRNDRVRKTVMAVEDVQALRKEFDAQQAGSHQQLVRKKVRKDLYCAYHGRSSHTTEQCRNIRQRGNAQDQRPQQGAAIEAPREAAQEQAPPIEQRQDIQRRVIQVITRADPPVQQSKRQKKMQLRTVYNIIAAGKGAPRYLNQQISFGPEDVEGVLFPHQDPLVISAKVAGFEVRRILVDRGSSADVIFAEAYAKMGLPTLALTEAPASLRGFGGKAVQVLGQVQLVIAFGTGENRREEQILFDVVNIPYNYNAIFGRATLNMFEAISHHNYLKLKMPGPTGVIVVKGLQPSTTSKGDMAAISRAVHNVEAEPHDHAKRMPKPAPHGKVIKMQVDDVDPAKLVLLGGDLGEEEAENILEAAKAEVQKLLKAGVIQEIDHPEWLANPVLVRKSNSKWRMCVDFTDLNKLSPDPHESGRHPQDSFHHTVRHFLPPGPTFARLVYMVLYKQLGRNVEAYVDDIVVKSRKAFNHASDLQQTFDNLRVAGMKLNPEKCVFGVRAGKLLGFLVFERGIKANPEKINAIQQMKPPSSIHEVQKLTGRISALSRFLSKAAETVLRGKEITGRLSKWAAELSPFDLRFVARTAIKSQVLADFVAEWTSSIAPDPEPVEQPWVMHSDGSWSHKGAGAATVLTLPGGVPIRYAARLQFDTTNNTAVYGAVLLGLRKVKALGVRRLLIQTDSKLVASHVDKSFEAKQEGTKRYLEAVRSMEKCFAGITVEHLPRGQNEEADTLAKSAACGGPHSPGIFFEVFYAPSVPTKVWTSWQSTRQNWAKT